MGIDLYSLYFFSMAGCSFMCCLFVFIGHAPGSGASTSGPSFSLGLEKDLAAKDAWIRALEQELEVAKKLAKENEAARKTAEERVEKMHQELKITRGGSTMNAKW